MTLEVLKAAAVGLGAGYLLLLALMFLFQRRLMYHRGRRRPDRAEAGAEDMAEVRLATADNLSLLAWYKEAAPGRPTVVLFHGNAGNIGHRAGKLRPLLDAGHGLLLVEWRGFGGNRGRPYELGLFTDGRAALDFLATRNVPRPLTVLYGESLGTGVAVRMAGDTRMGGLILEAPFTSTVDVAARLYWYLPVRHLLLDRYESHKRIASVGCPLLVLHGERDRVVPIGLGRALFARAREPKEAWWCKEAGHLDLYDHGAADVVLRFLDRIA